MSDLKFIIDAKKLFEHIKVAIPEEISEGKFEFEVDFDASSGTAIVPKMKARFLHHSKPGPVEGIGICPHPPGHC